MYLLTSTNFQIEASLTLSRAKPVESDCKTNLKVFIVHLLSLLHPYSNYPFRYDLHLNTIYTKNYFYRIK